MYAILAEDDSDAQVLKRIIWRHFSDSSLTIKPKGYGGCGGLCRKGARDIRSWLLQGVNRFIICHDADSHDPNAIRGKVLDRIVKPVAQQIRCCIAVPVQEIESWLLADETAISQIIPSFQFTGHPQPETIPSPKEWLVDKSKKDRVRPLYIPTTFNEQVADHMRLDVVARKCASFRAFISCLDQTFGTRAN